MDDFTPEQLRAEAIARGLIPADTANTPDAPTRQKQPGDNFFQNEDQNTFGFMSHPITNTMKGVRAVQDVAGGLMGSAQRLGSAIGETVEYPTHAAYERYTGNQVPHFPVREFMGLEGENRFDLREKISHDPNSAMSKVGGILPALAGGGLSIPRQMAAQGLWGAVQADPGQENLGGIAPSGRMGAALTDAALTGTVGAGVKYGLPAAASVIKKGFNYLTPNKDAEAFLKSLGSGTKEENVQALARDIDTAYQQKLDEALAHKKPVYEQEGKSNIYKTPESKLPEGNLDKVAYYIAPGEKTTPAQLEQLGKEIKNYRKSGDFDEFSSNVSEIFNADMSPTQVKNLEHALSIPTQADSAFFALAEKNPKLLSGKTRELFDKFKRRQTLQNADDLQSQLGADMGTFSSRAEKIGLDKGESYELEQLKELRDTLKSEMQGHLERVNPKLAEENKTFSDKYRSNVIPYQEEAATKTIANEPGFIKKQRMENPELPYNVTSSQMKAAFAEPGRQAQQIAGDIGEAGRNKILYNLLADDTKPEAKGLANAILEAKQSQGYSKYITPEMVDLANQLLKRTKWRERAAFGAKGLAGVLGVGAVEETIRRNL